jgi:hypothetical protein
MRAPLPIMPLADPHGIAPPDADDENDTNDNIDNVDQSGIEGKQGVEDNSDDQDRMDVEDESDNVQQTDVESNKAADDDNGEQHQTDAEDKNTAAAQKLVEELEEQQFLLQGCPAKCRPIFECLLQEFNAIVPSDLIDTEREEARYRAHKENNPGISPTRKPALPMALRWWTRTGSILSIVVRFTETCSDCRVSEVHPITAGCHHLVL